MILCWLVSSPQGVSPALTAYVHVLLLSSLRRGSTHFCVAANSNIIPRTRGAGPGLLHEVLVSRAHRARDQPPHKDVLNASKAPADVDVEMAERRLAPVPLALVAWSL